MGCSSYVHVPSLQQIKLNMQLVLLSGGSGKRLWPLSNNARSKQFLPLLENEDGSMESMVQRVVRQAIEARLTTDITLATNVNQLDIIINQLGETVSVVTEPERRDTFPAIALAASYLKLVKYCSDDEIVAIMPSDPYSDLDYFNTIGRMVECVKQNMADLVLMGIKPTYPSEKFGYIVPENEDSVTIPISDCKKVARFTEKPTVDKAKELLSQNAFWNGGVFAFRLGYMMNIVNKYIQSDSFEEVRNRYSDFPKISFDYEVVEKAESIAFVPFNGKWKDLGTWNTLTDELNKVIIGNAVMGIHCDNTHVINELKIPIYVDGLKNVVVVACPDGILACSKEYSEEIKKNVENFTSRTMYEERRWGTYNVLDYTKCVGGKYSLTKSVTLLVGKNISYQLHHNLSKVFTFVEGEGIFVLDGQEKIVKAGDTVIVQKGHWHAIKALTKLFFIEVQYGKVIDGEDIERTEWKWNE